MAVIDPEGMFNGDRMAMLSDEARLYWPHFWCASNTVGRIELNYRQFIRRAFHNFKQPLSEQRFWVFVREYRDCYLLFVYKYEGVVWGQWDTPKQLLRQYAYKGDLRTPAPPEKEFNEWRALYVAAKRAMSASDPLAEELLSTALEKLEKHAESSGQTQNEQLANFPENYKTFSTGREGIGIGVGKGTGNGKEAPLQFPAAGQPRKNRQSRKPDDDDKPPKPKFATDADELVALILRITGESPDRKLIESIRQFVEGRNLTLRAFLDDIEPRLARLKEKPSAGFFYSHARDFQGYSQQALVANEIRGPCCKFGVLPDGSCCTKCQTGRDLQRANLALEREKLLQQSKENVNA
jgi:hypothetical protein